MRDRPAPARPATGLEACSPSRASLVGRPARPRSDSDILLLDAPTFDN